MKGIEAVWFIGDSFCKIKIEQYLMLAQDKDYYCKTNFEVSAFYYDTTPNDSSLLNRLRTALVHGINKKIMLPKIIVVILEQDLPYFATKKYLFPREIKKVLSHLINEFRKVIAAAKDVMPAKAKRFGWPHVVWIELVQHTAMHDLDTRKQINSYLNDLTAVQQHMSCLRLKQVWDDHDQNLYLHQSRQFTSEGFRKFWLGVDRAVKYCDKVLMCDDSTAISTKQHSESRAPLDRFHWRREGSGDHDRRRNNHDEHANRRRLPNPFNRR